MKKALFLLTVFMGIAKLSFCQKQGQEKIDSLLSVLKTAKEDTAKVNTLNILASEFTGNNPDTAVYFASEALTLATKLNYKMGIADAHIYKGQGLRYQGKYKEQLENFNYALKSYDELLSSATTKDKLKIIIGKGRAYNNIGLTYIDHGNWPEGLKNYFSALKIFEDIGYKRGIAMVHSNIGSTYDDQSNYSEALKNYLAALKINEELGEKRYIAGNLNDIGTVYDDQGNDVEALKNYLEALKLNEELGNKLWKAINLNNIGNVYIGQGNYTEALKHHLAGLKISQEIGNKDMMASCCNNIGIDYTKLKKYSKASRYLNKGLSLAKEIDNPLNIQDNYIGLAELDSVQGNFKQSLENYKMYIIYRDSTVNKEATKKTMQIQMQYDFDKKESMAKSEQDKKDAIALKEMQKQKLLRNALIIGFALLLILGVIISIIKFQYEKIKLIEKERNRISGELHDDIGAELTRITVISQFLQKKTNKDDEMQEKLRKISESGKKVLGSIGEIIWTMNPQKDNLESLVAYIRRFVTEYLETNRIEVNIDFPNEIPVKSVSDEYRRNIFLAIKEAIYNITKYSKATRVRLSMHLDKGTAGIEIHDNGIGFSVKEKQNWGNGLTNMNQRMKDIKGDFQITSEKNMGTFIKLTFPVR